MSSQNPVFIPGPTNVPEVLRAAVNIPTMDHRSAAFPPILAAARAGVKKVVKSETAETILFSATGTGGWEAAIANTLSPGDKVLAGRNGMFSAKWIDMCERFGLEVEVLDVAWGEALPAARYAEALSADSQHAIKAVIATHNETATGVTSDIAAIREAIDAASHPALFFVDGVSSIGSMDFRMDEWGVDIAVSGSQKGFMLPAGMGIVTLSQKAIAAMETATLPRTFFDFRDMLNTYSTTGYPYTPHVGMMNGLALSTKLLLEEGLENVFARHRRIAEGVRAAVAGWGMTLCATSPDIYSDSVSAILVPEGQDGNALVAHASDKYGVSFGGGLGQVAGKVFRIGHLGSITDVMALAGVATAEMAMVDMGYDITLGSGVAAAQAFYRTHEAQSTLPGV